MRLQLDDDDPRRILKRLLTAGASRGSRAKTIQSVYYDTAAGKLLGAGYCLRTRSQGGKRVQHIAAASPTSVLRMPRNWTKPLADGVPSKDSIAGTPLVDILAGRALAKLMPVFSADIHRRRCVIEREGARIVAILDTGAISVGQAAERICELRLEIVAGPFVVLFDVARELGQVFPATLSLRSHGEKGFRLLHPQPGCAVGERHGDMQAEMRTLDAIDGICRNCAAALLDDLALLRADGDHNVLHQVRIGLRRLRAILSFCRPVLGPEGADLPARLRHLAQFLGRAREFDVFCDRMLVPLRRDNPGALGVDALLEAFEVKRREVRDEVLAHVRSPEMLAFGLWLLERLGELMRSEPSTSKQTRLRESTWADFAKARLGRRLAAFLKASRHLQSCATDEQHDIRIEAKKLRYATEAFQTIVGEHRGRQLVSKLQSLQDLLGELNDCATGHTLLLDYARDRAREGNAGLELFAAGLAAAACSPNRSEILARAVATRDELVAIMRSLPGKR